MKRILERLSAVAAGAVALALATPASAQIPYPNPGTANPMTYTFNATATGNVVAYFVGQTAAYGSVVGLSINGAAPLVWGLQNHASAYGTSFLMGSVTIGDTLRFVLDVSTSNGGGPPPHDHYLNSDPSWNAGNDNHIYSTAFAGDAWIPAGTYIGFEDIIPLNSGSNDRDYDDHQFVFTNVGVTTRRVPDSTSTLALLGVVAAWMLAMRRRLAE